MLSYRLRGMDDILCKWYTPWNPTGIVASKQIELTKVVVVNRTIQVSTNVPSVGVPGLGYKEIHIRTW